MSARRSSDGNGRGRSIRRRLRPLRSFEPDDTAHADGNGRKPNGGIRVKTFAPLPAAAGLRDPRRRAWHDLLGAARPSAVTGGAATAPLLVLFGLNTVDELDRVAFGVLLPEIRDWFGLDLQGVLTLSSIVGVFGILFAIPIGYFSDRRSRTRMSAAGAALWGASSLLTGLVPTVALLALCRFGSGAGKTLDPAHSSLLADYYEPKVRPAVYAFHRAANPIGQFVAPILAGLLATLFFWQLPFLLFALPSLALAWIVWRLPEPVRGEQERLAMGASAEVARTPEPPPGWVESWRVAKAVRTLRRLWWAFPFLVGAGGAIAQLMSLYYEEVFGLNAAQRGVLAAVNEPFAVAGLVVGGLIGNRLVRRRPGRVLGYVGAMGALGALSIALVAAVPVLPLAVFFSIVNSFARSVFAPTLTAIVSLVAPPRVRGFALSAGVFFALPGLAVQPFVGSLADAYGLRAGILLLVPVLLVGAVIVASSGRGVEPDMRAALAASMALDASRRSREEDDGKLLVCRGLEVSHGAVQALFGVDLDVRPGEMVAVLGTNGAGKTSLVNGLSGLLEAQGGAIFFDGRDVTRASPEVRARLGIIQAPGERGVFPGLSVAENLRLATRMHRREQANGSEELDEVLGLFPALRARLNEAAGALSGGERQMLMLAQALLARPRLLLADELSLGLSPAVVHKMLDVLRELKRQGTAVVVVEQSADIALEVADRAVFLEKGTVKFVGRARELLGRRELVRSLLLGTGGADARRAAPRRGPETERGTVLAADGLCKRFGGVAAVDGVHLEVGTETVLGIIGPNGAGKSTLFDLLSGFVRPDAGRIFFDGDDVTDLGPDQRARLGLARSFQDARLFSSLSVSDVMAVAIERELRGGMSASVLGLPSAREIERRTGRRVAELLEEFELGDFSDVRLAELPAGTRRLVDLACQTAAKPTVVLLDEPSAGMSLDERDSLIRVLLQLRREASRSLVVISHDVPLVSEVADELVAMDLGRVIASGRPEDVVRDPSVVASYLGSQPDRPAGVGVRSRAGPRAKSGNRDSTRAQSRKGGR